MRLIDADAFIEENKDIIDCEIDHPKYQDTLRQLINLAPTVERPQGEWIPCSERLPEAGQVVIVSDVRGDVYEYTMNPLNVDKYIDDKWTFMGYEILAWMPLPEPYKGEGEAE